MIQTEHHTIAPGEPPYVIAEVGLNHNGDLGLAKTMSEAAKACGAHAAKFQLFDVEFFLDPRAQLGCEPPGSLQDFFRSFQLKPAEWRELSEFVRSLGLDFMCSVFDAPSLELYVGPLAGRVIKIASGDLTNRMLIEDAVATGKPIILSTGASSAEEVQQSLKWFGPERPALLQCVSAYPAAPEEYDLNVIRNWHQEGILTGLSDHTPGNELAFASVAVGARIIEKHFTTERTLPGPDQALSSDPTDFSALCAGVRAVFASLGSGKKTTRPAEEPVRAGGRRSLHSAQVRGRGEVWQRSDLVALRPGGGLSPASYPNLIGRPAGADYAPADQIPASEDTSDGRAT